jgi:hypothetical protein
MNFELGNVFQHIIAHSAHADFDRGPGALDPGASWFDYDSTIVSGRGRVLGNDLWLRELSSQFVDSRPVRIDIQGGKFVL